MHFCWGPNAKFSIPRMISMVAATLPAVTTHCSPLQFFGGAMTWVPALRSPTLAPISSYREIAVEWSGSKNPMPFSKASPAAMCFAF
jgi:hypothetical protein